MSSGAARRLRRRLAKTSLLLVIVASALIFIAAATVVTVTTAGVAAYGGALVNGYYENQVPPVTGCSSPCLTADTQTTEPSSSPGAIGLDGSTTGTWSAGSSFTITASTTKPNDVVVLWIVTYISKSSIKVSSVKDSLGVTWQSSARVSNVECTATTHETTQTEWYGIASAALASDVITVTLSGTPTAASGVEFAVSGANTASPFDPNVSLPDSAACATTAAVPTVSGLSTSNANEFVVAVFGAYNSVTETVGAIANTTATLMQTNAGTGDSSAFEYTIASSAQSSQSCAFGKSTNYWSMVCDAIVQGSSSFTLPAGSSMYLWSPPFSAGATLPAGTLSLQLFADLPAPALDGTASGTWSKGTTFSIASFSTTEPNDVVILSIQTYMSNTTIGVSSVSDTLSKITWQPSARTTLSSCSGTYLSTKYEWYGIASSAVTADTITVTLGATPTHASGIAFGVSGADTVSPFDPSTSPPATEISTCTGTAVAPTISGVSTTADNDFVFAAYGGHTSKTETAGTMGGLAGSLIGAVNGAGQSNAVEYAISSSQSGTSCTFGTTTTYWGGICDALVPARQSVTVSYITTDSSGSLRSTMITGSAATITALYQPISLPTPSGSVPTSGYLQVTITAPSGSPLTVYWGSPKPTLFEVELMVRTT